MEWSYKTIGGDLMEQEFCDYLKQRHFKRFMQAWKKQYERLGTCGGKISVALDINNQEDIEMLMQKNYHRQTHANMTYSTMLKAIERTKFSGVDFNKVLLLYFNGEIITKKDGKFLKKQRDLDLIYGVTKHYQDTFSSQWIHRCIEENHYVFIRLRQEIDKNSKRSMKDLNHVMRALNNLPFKKQMHQSLVMFASEIIKDPHGFDKGTFTYYLLIQGIRYMLDDFIQEERIILHDVGLYEDTISNYYMVCHLDAYDLKQTLHQGWHGFYESYEMWNPNMYNMIQIYDIELHSIEKIFMVENPSIFYALSTYAKKNQLHQYGFICSNGQLHTSAYILLDLLDKYPVPIYYNGDYDPEGLLIVERLMKRYHHIELWHYEMNDYLKSWSNKYANEKRLASNLHLTHEKLIKIGSCLNQSPIGYQENILDDLLEDLKK